ncbi:MAG: oligosaccharide flippase family protein [Acidobacteriota bacterium]
MFSKSGLVRTSFVAVLVRGGGAVLALAANVILARVLGPQIFGRYLYVFSWSLVLGGLATMGTGPLLVREIAGDESSGQAAKTVEVTRWALGLTGMVAISFCAGLAAFFWFGYHDLRREPALIILAAILIPLLTGILLAQAVLRGKGRVIWGQSLMTLFRNALLLTGALTALGLGLLHGATVVLILQCLAIGLALLIGWFLIQRIIPGLLSAVVIRARTSVSHLETEASKRARKGWLKTSLFFLFATAGTSFMNQLDIVVVGWFGSERIVGFYGVAAKVGNMISLIGVAGLLVLQPRIVQIAKMQDLGQVKRLLRRAVALFGIPALFCVGLVAVFGHEILLALVPQYMQALPALILIAMSNTAYCLTVPFLAFLSMTGREKQIAWIIWSQLVLNVFLNVFLVPIYGATGGGVARATALIAGSAAIYLVASKHIFQGKLYPETLQ